MKQFHARARATPSFTVASTVRQFFTAKLRNSAQRAADRIC